MGIYCYCYTVLWLHCTRSLKDTMSLLIGRYWVFHWPCVFFFPLALKLQESLAVYEDCSHELKEDKEILTTQQSIVGWGENWEVDTKGFYLLLYSSALRALLLPPLWLYNEYCEICLINKQIWKSKILWRFCFSKFKLNTTKLCFFGQYFEIAKSKALSLQIWFILYLSLITIILNVVPYVTEVKPQAHYMDIKYLCSMVLLYSQGSLYMYNNVLSLPCPPVYIPVANMYHYFILAACLTCHKAKHWINTEYQITWAISINNSLVFETNSFNQMCLYVQLNRQR